MRSTIHRRASVVRRGIGGGSTSLEGLRAVAVGDVCRLDVRLEQQSKRIR